MDDQQGTLFGEWGRKDATLSDTTAQKTYGLPQAEIIDAIRGVSSTAGRVRLTVIHSFVSCAARSRPWWRRSMVPPT